MSAGPGLRGQLLGPFALSAGDRAAGPWPRPSARRLVELVLVTPGHRIRRDVACEALFGDRDQRAASRALSKALSMARAALAELGEPGRSLLAADLTHIWLDGCVETDAGVCEAALRGALDQPAGPRRTTELRAALAAFPPGGELLPDEPDEEWARWPRERLAALREEARLALDHAGELPPVPAPREDRRPVSVLFAEVTAAPAVTGTEDLEELRESVSRVLATVMGEAEALGGTVSSVSGRGLQALFGVPAAHEDDPERAVRAAYRAVARTSPSSVLRIGVESGPAVVGPVTDLGREEYAAFGDAVGLAAALQSAARPGSVLVGPATRAATEHLFTWEAAENVAVDPGAEPVTASYVAGPRARSGGRRPALGGTAPLTGRETETKVLGGALRDLAAGRGAVLALTGGPGIGKTRMVQEARTRFAAWTGTGTGRLPLWLAGRCPSYASGTPYALYRDLLATWTGVALDQPARPRRDALEESLRRVMGNTTLLPPLARLAGLPGTGEEPAGPAEVQRMITGAMRALLTRLAAVAPTVMVLEDLHWADPTSLHLTRQLADLTRERPLLLLVTARDEAAGTVESIAADVRRIPLGPLAPPEARAVARSLLGGAADDVLDAVVSPARGNPLFVEERLAALLETSALVQEDGAWSLRDTGGPRLSQVLERLVRSRVDRLSDQAQEAVRAAAVLGFEFSTAQLAAMLDGAAPASLDPVLKELVTSDLIHHRRPRGDEPAFVFRHALIQEAAYLGLLRAERRALHARAAAAIEAAEGGSPAVAASVLSWHYAQAGDDAQAVRCLELAGDHATDAFANDEAIASFRAGIDLAARHDAMTGASVRLYDKLANVLWRTGRRPETRDAFSEALRIGPADIVRQAYLYTRLGRVNLLDSRFADAEEAFDAAGVLLGGDPGHQGDAVADRWLELMIDGRADLHWLRGELDLGEDTLRQASAVLDRSGTAERKAVFCRLSVMLRLERNGWCPANEDVELLRRGLEFARQAGDEKDIAYSSHFLGWVLGLHGDLEEARKVQETAVDLAGRVGESYLLPGALVTLGLLALRQGDIGASRTALRQAAAAARDSERGGDTTLAPEGTAAEIVLSWLDRPVPGTALAEELDRLVATVTGVTRRHLEPFACLARGLRGPS